MKMKDLALAQVRRGERFTLDGVEFVKLEDDMDAAFAVAADTLPECCQFEDDDAEREDHNNYAGSLLSKTVERWLRDKHPAIFSAVVERPIDLTTMDGMTDYGKPLAVARALTIDEYRKHRSVLPLTSKPYWLATGWTTNSSPYGTGTGVTLIRKDAFSGIAWNASDRSYYKNSYFGCTLDNFCDGIWPLKLDEKIRECLVPVPIVVAEGNRVATLHTIYRKGFAISCTEAGVSGWQTEGKAFSYFSDNAKRIAYLDETATAVLWGLRSPYSDVDRAYCIDTDGTVSGRNVYDANLAPRPAFNLKSSIVVSDSKDSDGCYTVESVPGNDGGLYVKNNGLWVRAV